jgi:hypothetical protein
MKLTFTVASFRWKEPNRSRLLCSATKCPTGERQFSCPARRCIKTHRLRRPTLSGQRLRRCVQNPLESKLFGRIRNSCSIYRRGRDFRNPTDGGGDTRAVLASSASAEDQATSAIARTGAVNFICEPRTNAHDTATRGSTST